VPGAVTTERLEAVLRVVHTDLKSRFGIANPVLGVCGLNPHAGESGHLGKEEQQVIAPALERLRGEGIVLHGPLPADTAFTTESLRNLDVVVAMFHDQGLPVIKHEGFGEVVNVTLGLPFIRTSVDHGTALDLVGTGRADAGSLRSAVGLAQRLSRGV
ncbi:MAG: 4-hydroxythreonine-4-phosphate dehydrogenase PdxA, partial [Gammaproteobacteria bacterium]